MAEQKKSVLFLIGPTAVGKSEVGVHLAKKINAEIISCDSMQIYKKMDIITSKPAMNLRRKIRHHLIDVVPADKEYDVSKYRKDALKKIKEIQEKSKIPLFAGGTGLYMSILVDGIFETEGNNLRLRKKLYKEASVKGNQYLYKRLQEADPQAAKKIHPHDTKRIIRALEVFTSTGKPISSLQKQRKGLNDEFDVRIFCLNMERQELYKRIEKRVDKMFAQGLVVEVKRLLKLSLSRTASYAIGIRELRDYFKGLYDLERAKELIKRNTRRYAKSQLTWFRKDKRIRWIEVDDKSAKEVAEEIHCSLVNYLGVTQTSRRPKKVFAG